MLKRYKKIKVLIVVILIFVVIALSVIPINRFIQKQYGLRYSNSVLILINDSFSKMNFNVKGEEGNYSLEFKDVKLKSEYKEIKDFIKGEASVIYVFKHSHDNTESSEFQIEIPIIRDTLKDEFSIDKYDKSEELEITTEILESFLNYKFNEYHSKVEHDECIGETDVVSEVIYDYSEMHYDRFGSIIDGSSISFDAKKMNTLWGMTFSGVYTKSTNEGTHSFNMEINGYSGELEPLWSVNYENVKEIKVYEEGKYEHTILDKELIQRIFSLINEFKYDQISSKEMQNIAKNNDYSLIFNDGIFEYYVVVGGKGIVIINDRSAASEEASQDLEFFLKMEI